MRGDVRTHGCGPWFLGLALCALVVAVPSSGAAAAIHGEVRGGGQRRGVSVAALRSRDLRITDNVIDVASVDPRTGRFALTVPAGAAVHLIVLARCDVSQIRADRLDACLRFHPHHAAVSPDGEARRSLVLQVPDPDAAQALWRGTAAPVGPHRSVGYGLLVFLVFAAGWLHRLSRGSKRPPRSEDEMPLPRQPSPWPMVRWVPLIFIASTALLVLPRLGTEDLDLLEYSYFHEGVRPESARALLTDPVSAELAHGPVTPLLLRSLERISRSPWLLRLPSAALAIVSVLVVFVMVRRELGLRAAVATAGLSACLPLAVLYARDATPYALAGACAVLSVWLAQRARDAARSFGWWGAFALVQVVGFFAHYAYAFASVALALALSCAWWRRRPADLARALVAFAAAGVLPVTAAPQLVHMLESSGLRFALMSPVYPESPGVVPFGASFLCALSGVPPGWPLALIPVAALAALGFRELWRRSSLLFWLAAAQLVLLVVWLVFTHEMSTRASGGHVFYAFRWARPLTLALLLPLGASVLGPARWTVSVLGAVALWQSVALAAGPTRPAQSEAARIVLDRAQPGDVVAVLPAAFYGDPLNYHLFRGSPPNLITRMRPGPIGGSLFGPLLGIDLPLETELDHAGTSRIWLVAYRETMLGVAKFDPGVAARTLAWMDGTFRRLEHHALASLDLYLFESPGSRIWAGARRLPIDLDRPFRAGRFIARPADGRTIQGASIVPLVLPGDATSLSVEPPGPGLEGGVTFRSDRLVAADGFGCTLRPGATPTRVDLVRTGATRSGPTRVWVGR